MGKLEALLNQVMMMLYQLGLADDLFMNAYTVVSVVIVVTDLKDTECGVIKFDLRSQYEQAVRTRWQ